MHFSGNPLTDPIVLFWLGVVIVGLLLMKRKTDDF